MNPNELNQLLSYLTMSEGTIVRLLEKDVEFLTDAADVVVCTAETHDVSLDRMRQIKEELNRQTESVADDLPLNLFFIEVNPAHELLVQELQELVSGRESDKTLKWGLRQNPQITSLRITGVLAEKQAL